MKDREFKRQQDRVRKLLDKWVDPLGLGDWQIKLFLFHDALPGRESEGGAFAPVFQTESSWEYKMARIDGAACQTADCTDAELERLLVHELVHSLVAEMREEDPDHKHEERVVTSITDAILCCVNYVGKEN